MVKPYCRTYTFSSQDREINLGLNWKAAKVCLQLLGEKSYHWSQPTVDAACINTGLLHKVLTGATMTLMFWELPTPIWLDIRHALQKGIHVWYCKSCPKVLSWEGIDTRKGGGCMCLQVPGSPGEGVRFLELKLQVTVSCPTRVLEIKVMCA